MNKKIVILLVLMLSVIFTFLLSQYGSNPYSDAIVQATYIDFVSDSISFGEGANAENKYYELPYLNENEVKYVDLQNFVSLDENATYQKDTLVYEIIYDNAEESDYLTLGRSGVMAGRLTVSGQTSAKIIVKTTDGSNLSATLFIKQNHKNLEEEHGGGIFN